MPDIQLNTEKLLKFVYEKYQKDELNADSLLELIKLCGDLLNIKSIPKYAKENKMSYPGVLGYRRIGEIFEKKFVIEED